MKLQINVSGIGGGAKAARSAKLAAEVVRRRETERRLRRDQDERDRALDRATSSNSMNL
jgi:flavin-dependent dehydrogenase